MMNLIEKVIAIMVLLGAGLSVSAYGETILDYPREEYEIPKAKVIPTIDGVISQAEWGDALARPMVVPGMMILPRQGGSIINYDGPSSPLDFSMHWYLKWDETTIYIAVLVYDDDFYFPPTGGYPGKDDLQVAFNLLDLDGPPDDKVIIDISARGNVTGDPDLYQNWISDPLDGVPVAATLQDDYAYVVEVALPWGRISTGLYPSAQVGDVHGIGLLGMDWTSGGEQTAYMMDFGRGWNTIEQPYNKVMLVEELPSHCGVWGHHEADIDLDCEVNLADIAMIAADWGKCSDPNDPACTPAD